MIEYAQIEESKCEPFKGNHRQYMTVHGYTKKCGAPTDYMVKLKGET